MLIAISARKRHGKDTVANYIVKNHEFHKYVLAVPFKQGLHKYLGFTQDQIEGVGFDREAEFSMSGEYVKHAFIKILEDQGYFASIYKVDWKPIETRSKWSVRTLMQTIGTDVGVNQVDKLIWMHPMVEFMKHHKQVIISDCRQEHEMDLMRIFGAKVIHVVNPYIENQDTHITEKGLAVYPEDKVIHNPYDPSWGSRKTAIALLQLHTNIKSIMNEIQ